MKDHSPAIQEGKSLSRHKWRAVIACGLHNSSSILMSPTLTSQLKPSLTSLSWTPKEATINVDCECDSYCLARKQLSQSQVPCDHSSLGGLRLYLGGSHKIWSLTVVALSQMCTNSLSNSKTDGSLSPSRLIFIAIIVQFGPIPHHYIW